MGWVKGGGVILLLPGNHLLLPPKLLTVNIHCKLVFLTKHVDNYRTIVLLLSFPLRKGGLRGFFINRFKHVKVSKNNSLSNSFGFNIITLKINVASTQGWA